MKKIIMSVTVITLFAGFAMAQNSYMAQPGNGSLFENKNTEIKHTDTQTATNKIAPKRAPKQYNILKGHWGIGIKAGVAQNNPKDMKETYDDAFDYGWDEKELTRRPAYYGLEALYEWDLSTEANKLGVKIGVEGYGQNKLELTDHYYHQSFKAKENTYAFPITVYYKRDNGIKKWSWMAGAGVTIMRSEIKIETNYDGNEKDSKTKVFPHIMAGAEYRLSQLFALGVEARYNIAAKIKKDGGILSDRSGFGGMLTARFYF